MSNKQYVFAYPSADTDLKILNVSMDLSMLRASVGQADAFSASVNSIISRLDNTDPLEIQEN